MYKLTTVLIVEFLSSRQQDDCEYRISANADWIISLGRPFILIRFQYFVFHSKA